MKKIIKYFVFILTVITICIISGNEFMAMWQDPELFPGNGLTEKVMLSDWFNDLKNTPFDTPVFIFKGEIDGGKVLLLGGTHANEPAAALSAITLLENIDECNSGTIYIIPWANHSAITHTDQMEGDPQFFHIETSDETRRFRYGSRRTNAIHQWPDPTIYIHPEGTVLGGQETTNLNRSYPGRENGYWTEKLAYAITSMIRQEEIDFAVDLHESSPEYPVNNAIVFHQDAAELAVTVQMMLEMNGIDIGLEESPPSLRGLSHREWGDHTDTQAILFEVSNPAQGRMRGKSSEELIITGKDKFYVNASERGQLYVPYNENGYPLVLRVARHVATFDEFLTTWNMFNPEKLIEVEGIPGYEELLGKGLGAFL